MKDAYFDIKAVKMYSFSVTHKTDHFTRKCFTESVSALYFPGKMKSNVKIGQDETSCFI